LNLPYFIWCSRHACGVLLLTLNVMTRIVINLGGGPHR
jgi:hypothetical protein